MEPFTIQCTTCRARLKVQNEAALGQILDCPKCGSMVHVAPPDAPTATVAAVAMAPPAKPAVPQSPAITTISTVVAPPPLPRRAATGPEAAPPIQIDGTTSIGATVTKGSPWTRLAVQARQNWPLLSGGFATGVVAAISVWILLSSLGSEPERDVVAAKQAAVVDDDSARPNPGKQPPASRDEPRPISAEFKSHGPPAPEPAENLPTNRDTAAPADTNQQNEATPAPEAAAPTAVKPVLVPKPEPLTNEPKFDVLKAPAEPDAETEMDSAVANADRDDAEKADDSPDDDAAPEIDESRHSADGSEVPGAQLLVNSPASSARKVPLTESTIETRLNDQLPSVQFEQVPLARYLEFLSEFTTIPITIDLPALRKLSKGPETKVTVKLSGASVAQALQVPLAEHGLSYAVEGSQIVVTARQQSEK